MSKAHRICPGSVRVRPIYSKLVLRPGLFSQVGYPFHLNYDHRFASKMNSRNAENEWNEWKMWFKWKRNKNMNRKKLKFLEKKFLWQKPKSLKRIEHNGRRHIFFPLKNQLLMKTDLCCNDFWSQGKSPTGLEYNVVGEAAVSDLMCRSLIE